MDGELRSAHDVEAGGNIRVGIDVGGEEVDVVVLRSGP